VGENSNQKKKTPRRSKILLKIPGFVFYARVKGDKNELRK